MRRLSLLLASIGVLAVLGACAPAAPTEGWQNQMMARINAERAAVGAAPLHFCGTLTLAAQGHSAYQAASNTMSHVGSSGSTLAQRANNAGYVGWTNLAENVAAGHPHVDAVMNGWMGSAGHRNNLLSTSYTHVGIGRAPAGSGTLYWTQNFGRNGSC